MAASPFVIYKTHEIESHNHNFKFSNQHTEGLHNQDTDGGNPQGDHK